MNFLTRTISLLIITIISQFAHASVTCPPVPSCVPVQTVPFQNLVLPPNCTVHANYSFGQNSIIFCYENSLQNVGGISWTYKGVCTAQQVIPIFLKTQSNIQGSFADANGSLSIQNNLSVPMTLSCQFAL